jgi:hypothetical protein
MSIINMTLSVIRYRGAVEVIDRIVVGFITTFAISVLSPLTLWVWIPFRRGVLYTTLCQWLVLGRWFSPGTPVSFTNKTDRHDITEILLKMVLNTITLTLKGIDRMMCSSLLGLLVLYLQWGNLPDT